MLPNSTPSPDHLSAQIDAYAGNEQRVPLIGRLIGSTVVGALVVTTGDLMHGGIGTPDLMVSKVTATGVVGAVTTKLALGLMGSLWYAAQDKLHDSQDKRSEGFHDRSRKRSQGRRTVQATEEI